ncbi:protein kinase [Streptomyces sp. NPDC058045]|uniref:protein kinase n=1 Tax=Streptomyces sp. NPDC058045 TaxID=3346311 RepID=UPI0036EF7C5A
MEEYAGRVLADRYRLPLPPSEEYDFAQTTAFDTYSGQEVLVRQVPLPEVVEAEVLDEGDGYGGRGTGVARTDSGALRTSSDPAVRRAIEAAQAAAQLPDHPLLDQVFDVFAEGGSLWVVSEVVAARPLAALLADRTLSPYRAAEVAADVLTAMRALHAHGWVHRNITAHTVLVCDDGRTLLTGLAAGAAEEALCGYDPRPEPEPLAQAEPDDQEHTGDGASVVGATGGLGDADRQRYGARYGLPGVPAGGRAEAERGAERPLAERQRALGTGESDPRGGTGPTDARAARAGAIAAYRAGTRAAAAARITGERSGEREASRDGEHSGDRSAPDSSELSELPGQYTEPPDTAPELSTRSGQLTTHTPALPAQADEPLGLTPELPAGATDLTSTPDTPDTPAPGAAFGQIADPYGVRPPYASAPWQAGVPRQADASAVPGGEAGPSSGRDAVDEGEGQRGTSWGELVEQGAAPVRGPGTALAAERARHARMAVIGPVTERWAPEQAGPVHQNWQLAAPVGPATDLWALGALLFRAVQGHAPYPEDSAAELVQMVCAEPPAFAEECGPLRPVVESLLRQDPTERPDFEELRGWLRSLVRSAPEPEAGTNVVTAPPLEPGPGGTGRLPVVRRRGELARKRRESLPAAAHGRHKRSGGSPRPRRLGRLLLLVVLLGLAAAVAYAMLFMPKAGEGGAGARPVPGHSSDAGSVPGSGQDEGPGKSGSQQPQTTGPGLPDGYVLRRDAAGFRIAVPKGWTRHGKNSQGQVVYGKGRFELIVVPGRDSAGDMGRDPMTYQQEKEPELRPFRDSSWATSGGRRRIDVGERAMAEGQFTWQGDNGYVFARNVAMLIGGRYHVVQVRGPDAERDEVTSVYQQASGSYQPTS